MSVMISLFLFVPDSDVSHFRDEPGWCSGGHYRMGKRVTINKCAAKCVGETQCKAFSYLFSKTPTCYLYSKSCEDELKPHEKLSSHTFIKIKKDKVS